MKFSWNTIALCMPQEIRELCTYASEFEMIIGFIINDINSGRYPSVKEMMDLSNLLETLLTQTLSIVKKTEKDPEEVKEIERKFKAIRIEIVKFREDLKSSQTRKDMNLLEVAMRDLKLFYDSILVPSILETREKIKIEALKHFSFAVKSRIGIIPTKKEVKEATKEIEGEE